MRILESYEKIAKTRKLTEKDKKEVEDEVRGVIAALEILQIDLEDSPIDAKIRDIIDGKIDDVFDEFSFNEKILDRFLKRQKRKQFYEALGLSEGASLSTIKKAFRKLSLQYHPDKLNVKLKKNKITQEEYEKGEKRWQKILDAYEFLVKLKEQAERAKAKSPETEQTSPPK